jgi:uncharacterized membrane protein
VRAVAVPRKSWAGATFVTPSAARPAAATRKCWPGPTGVTARFALSTFLSWWFLLYFALRQIALFGQLYVFSAPQLGRTMALFGATSLVVVNVLDILLPGEVLSPQACLAIGLVILGFVVLSMSP